MTIKGVVFDVSGTLLDGSLAQPGIPAALDALRALGLTIVAASNDPVVPKLRNAGLDSRIDHVITKQEVTVAKGSPLWVEAFRKATGFLPNELLYVGDSRLDMVTATRGPMIYMHAAWSGASSDYGLKAPSPQWVVAVVRHILCKQHPWYWELSVAGRMHAVALLNAGNLGQENRFHVPLLELFKDEHDHQIGVSPMLFSEFVMLHMLASLYATNLFGGIDFWTTYPGHQGTPNRIMGNFLAIASKLSRNSYRDDLFDRYRLASKSNAAYRQGGSERSLRNQLESVRVGPTYKGKLTGKRILLLDNFLTHGYSTETGRNLLLAAGVAEVVVACVGKYGARMHTIVSTEMSWDPYSENAPPTSSFVDAGTVGLTHLEAMNEFSASYDGMSHESW